MRYVVNAKLILSQWEEMGVIFGIHSEVRDSCNTLIGKSEGKKLIDTPISR
jgi:hypothetical protein